MAGGHKRLVSVAAFSPDGRLVVTASHDKTARIWDAETGAQLAVLAEHTKEVDTAEFSPDGRQILTSSFDGTAKVWDAPAPASAGTR
jgi:WD40 repeat protein